MLDLTRLARTLGFVFLGYVVGWPVVALLVIATGFDHGRPTPRSTRDSLRDAPRNRDVSLDREQRNALEISDDDIDIPAFLRRR